MTMVNKIEPQLLFHTYQITGQYPIICYVGYKAYWIKSLMIVLKLMPCNDQAYFTKAYRTVQLCFYWCDGLLRMGFNSLLYERYLLRAYQFINIDITAAYIKSQVAFNRLNGQLPFIGYITNRLPRFKKFKRSGFSIRSPMEAIAADRSLLFWRLVLYLRNQALLPAIFCNDVEELLSIRFYLSFSKTVYSLQLI